MSLNSNLNWNLGRRAGGGIPLADVLLWKGSFSGDDLLNTIGANPTYVSGTGLDAIYDFSVLSDVRLDKSNATYWGATLDPYFYYDPANPYHAKLKDYSYRQFQAQMTSDNNFAFGSLIYNAGVLQNVNFIAIYSVEQIDNNLTQLKSYIGILETFYGDENIINGGAEGEEDWPDTDLNGVGNHFSVIRAVGSIVTGNGFTGNAQRFVMNGGETNSFIRPEKFTYTSAVVYRTKFKYRTDGYLQIVGGFTIPNIPANTGDAIEFEYIGSSVSSVKLVIYCYGSGGTYAEIDELSMQIVYENYYANEVFFN